MRSKRLDVQTRARMVYLLLDEGRTLKANLSRVFYAFDDDTIVAKLLLEVHALNSRQFYDESTKTYVPATFATIQSAVTAARAQWRAEIDETEARFVADIARLVAAGKS